MLQEIRVRAKKRGFEFNLTEEDIAIPLFCPVLGIRIRQPGENETRLRGCKDNSPSVDRIDQQRGYVKGNVIVVSWRANRLKSDASLDELRAVLRFYEPLLRNVDTRKQINILFNTGTDQLDESYSQAQERRRKEAAR